MKETAIMHAIIQLNVAFGSSLLKSSGLLTIIRKRKNSCENKKRCENVLPD